MRVTRRNVLMGLGTVVVGGGAALGSGAFTSVEASRDVSVSVADDANALIGLSAGSSDYVSEDGGTDGNLLEIDLSDQNLDADGVNLGGTVTIDDAFTVTNNHGEAVLVTIGEAGTLEGSGVTVSFLDGDAPVDGVSLDAAGGSNTSLDVSLEIETAEDATEFDESVTITAEPDGSA